MVPKIRQMARKKLIQFFAHWFLSLWKALQKFFAKEFQKKKKNLFGKCFNDGFVLSHTVAYSLNSKCVTVRFYPFFIREENIAIWLFQSHFSVKKMIIFEVNLVLFWIRRVKNKIVIAFRNYSVRYTLCELLIYANESVIPGYFLYLRIGCSDIRLIIHNFPRPLMIKDIYLSLSISRHTIQGGLLLISWHRLIETCNIRRIITIWCLIRLICLKSEVSNRPSHGMRNRPPVEASRNTLSRHNFSRAWGWCRPYEKFLCV